MPTPYGHFFRKLFLLDIYTNQSDAEDSRRLVMVNTICFFAIVVLILIGTVSLFRGYTTVGLLDILSAAILTLCLFYLRWTGKHRLPINTGISIMTLLYFYLFITGGANHTGFVWYYTYPVFTLYIMEKKDAVIANTILLMPSFIYLVMIWLAETPPYSSDFSLRFIPSVTSIFIFSYLFETTRIKTQNKFQSQQLALEKSINALQDKEIELQTAHDELEVRIEQRTRALQQSNETLMIEIEERKRSEAHRKKLEAQLAHAQKMEALGTLAGGVAHDLNNLLSGISSYPELLMMKVPKDSPMYRSLKIIESSGRKAATIVEDLLTLSRRGAAVFEPVDLQQVVQDYLDSPECGKMLSFHPNVRLKTHIDSKDYFINGSVVHLSKTIMNLLTNAAESMPEGGCVTIRLEHVNIVDESSGNTILKPGPFIKFTVMDEGVGITQEALEHIFEPFFTTKKMGRSGTGLGMAVVWGTVQDHKGHIDVQSLPEKGTTFELYFPAVDKSQNQPILSPANTPQGSLQSILVVDDVFEQREIATGILQTLGYSVQSLSCGEDAVAFLKKNTADLVLLDMTMDPGINGLETYQRIRRFKPNQKVVIASGFSESDLIHQALALGVSGYIKKPYSVASLAKAVAEGLSNS